PTPFRGPVIGALAWAGAVYLVTSEEFYLYDGRRLDGPRPGYPRSGGLAAFAADLFDRFRLDRASLSLLDGTRLLALRQQGSVLTLLLARGDDDYIGDASVDLAAEGASLHLELRGRRVQRYGGLEWVVPVTAEPVDPGPPWFEVDGKRFSFRDD